MYFSGKGNDSSLGTCSLTLGSTWWRWMQFPDMHGPEIISSFAIIRRWVLKWWRSVRRLLCSSPRSGRSRTEVDVLRTWSPPDRFTVPSATWSLKFPLLCGVGTSFALSLSAWISDASIFSNPQCLRPRCLLSRFSPRATHTQGIYLVKLSCRTDAVATSL